MVYTLEKARILVVDDTQPMLALVNSILNTFGFENIHTARNGEEAFKIICKHDPDLIITDWVMSPVNGLELAELVRRNPMTPNPYVPILFMTGYSARARVELARDNGVTEFLVKPFTAADLYKRIVQIIEKPRQFVDCESFFGPDRRRRSDEEYQGPRRRDGDGGSHYQNTPDQNNMLRNLADTTKNII